MLALAALVPGAFRDVAGILANADRPLATEERFALELWTSSVWIRVLSLVAAGSVVKATTRIRRGVSEDGCFADLVLAAALALGLAQLRFSYVVGSLRMVAVAVLLFDAARVLRGLPGSSRVRWAPALLFAPLFLWQSVLPRFTAGGEACAHSRIGAIADWLANDTPATGTEGPGAPYGVFAPWTIGHQLHVAGRRPVVVDPFTYRWDDDRDLVDVLREVWLSRTGGELAGALTRYRARYLVMPNNPAHEIFEMLGRDPGLRAEILRFEPGETVFPPAIGRFVAFRLFMNRGFTEDAARLEPRFFGAETDTYWLGERDRVPLVVPRAQVYEVKAGATLFGTAAAEVVVAADVRWRDGRRETVLQSAPVGADGRFRFATALPAPIRGDGFEVLGGYRLSSGVRTAVVDVSQDMVDAGSAVEVAWQPAPARVDRAAPAD
jgi:hypothetical protein